MAEKKSKVKAHRGFAHVRPRRDLEKKFLQRRRPTADPAPVSRTDRRPRVDPAPQIRVTPRRQKRVRSQSELQAMSDAQLRRYFNRQIKQNVRQRLSPAARRRFIRNMRRANLTPQQRKAELVKFDRMQSNLRKGLDFQGRPIPRGRDQVSQFRQQMKNMPKEQKQLMEMSRAISESKAQKDLRQKALEQQLRAQAKNVATQRTGVSPAQRKQMVASAQRTPPMTTARRAQVMKSMLRPKITSSGMGVERVYSDAEIARATRAQGRAKGGAVFKEKDYVNLSNIKDNLKKK
tara:strand:- start:639 stop:1511 length:873 start_codon:yes stop_codon:yes gene_type:complete